jgi:beta-glucanase (GH16 family)
LNQQVTIAFEVDLEEHDSSLFEMANGWTNGDMFDCTWRQENITFENGIMKLTIDTDGENASPKWSGGEYRTKKFYSYGLYEVRMKPIKNNGVVSSFFTYTGPSDNNPWDEIDIEFLGKDTTKIQFNYFMNGVGEHEYMHDLGFDASEEFHTYAFEWLPDAITWYVDGESVHTATENIPSTPSKVMMNAWPGIGVDAWLNAFDGIIPLNAEYDWIRVTQYDAPVKE